MVMRRGRRAQCGTLELMYLRALPAALALLLVSACPSCSSGEGSADAANPPLLDTSSGWQRVGFVPVTGKLSNSMTAVDLSIFEGQVHAMYREETQHSSLPTFFKCGFPPGAPADITPLNMGPRVSGGGTDYDNEFLFAPESATGFHAVNTYPHGNLAVATSEVRRDDETVFVKPFQGNGGTFSGALPDILADGSVIWSTGLSSSGANGAYWWHWLVYYEAKTGVMTRAISQGLSQYTPHATTAFRAARLPSGKIYGAMTTYDDVAIATVGTAKPGEDPPIDRVAAATFPGHAAADTLRTRVVGDTLYFVTWDTHAEKQTFSGYRWKEGTTTIDQLYANVAVAAQVFGPPKDLVENAQIDDKGDVWFLGAVVDGTSQSVVLQHVGAGVSTIVSRPALGGTLTMSALRLLGGEWYAGVGPTSNKTDGKLYLDVVRLTR